MVLILCITRGMGAAVFQVLYLYTPESYPTHIRALAMGLGTAFCRVGATITPFAAEVLLANSLTGAMILYGLLAVIGAICAFCLPFETEGRALKTA